MLEDFYLTGKIQRLRPGSNLRTRVPEASMLTTIMRRVTFASLTCMAVPYFSTFSHKRHEFLETLLDIKCEFLFPLKLLSKTFLILRRTR
jgi:hypothetical protein